MIKPFCYSRLDLLVNNCVLNIVKHLCKIEVIGRGHIRKIPIFFNHGTNLLPCCIQHFTIPLSFYSHECFMVISPGNCHEIHTGGCCICA